MDEEFTAEDLADAERMDWLYSSLSEEYLYYIVNRWDEAHGLEPAWKRENHKSDEPNRRRRRRLLLIAAVPAGVLLWMWTTNYQQACQNREDDSFVLGYLKEHAKELPGLQSTISQAEREGEELRLSQAPDRPDW